MTSEQLTAQDLSALVRRVFEPGPADNALLVMTDLPDTELPDNEDWRQRRNLAADWVRMLRSAKDDHGLEVNLCVYRNVRANNANLPERGCIIEPDDLPDTADAAGHLEAEPFADIFARHSLAIAPTELSATAPLKVLSRQIGFRAATMPGFGPAMIPALRLDYTEVNRRCLILKDLLDHADGADVELTVAGEVHKLHLDLRHRSSHASGGLLTQPGTAGNLPSGETYIVPYEGELADDPTTTAGRLPVQHGDEVVVYRIEGNRAIGVESEGPMSTAEAARLQAEPAYGNIAELGLGVLADFGIEPIGETLLDEKLGLHIAFGRSEHFGGQVGPDSFTSPDKVVHIDYVYLPQIQPKVESARVYLIMDDEMVIPLIDAGKYIVDF